MDNIVIRRAECSDFEYVHRAICELENEIFEIDSFKLIFNSNIHNSDYVYYILCNNAETIGLISFHTQNLLHHCGRVGEIQEFYIDKEYRNKGLGKLLMQEIESYSLTNDLKSIEVTSNQKRIENIKIYEKYGLKLTHNKFTRTIRK